MGRLQVQNSSCCVRDAYHILARILATSALSELLSNSESEPD